MAKNIGVMRVFRRALLSRKNCHFYFNAKKSHFRSNAFQMWFERATIWILLADYAPYGDDSDYIPCAIKLTRNSWIFFWLFLFYCTNRQKQRWQLRTQQRWKCLKSYQISRCSIQNIAIGIRTAKHIRYSVDFLRISQLKDWRWVFKMPVIYVAKKSTHARRITFVLG